MQYCSKVQIQAITTPINEERLGVEWRRWWPIQSEIKYAIYQIRPHCKRVYDVKNCFRDKRENHWIKIGKNLDCRLCSRVGDMFQSWQDFQAEFCQVGSVFYLNSHSIYDLQETKKIGTFDDCTYFCVFCQIGCWLLTTFRCPDMQIILGIMISFWFLRDLSIFNDRLCVLNKKPGGGFCKNMLN